MRETPMIVAIVNAHSSRVLRWRQDPAGLDDLAEFCESADFLEHTDQRPDDLARKSGRLMLKARTTKEKERLAVFLRRVAAQIDLAVGRYKASRLAILAPPLVLGELRDLITASTRMKLVREVTEDRTHDRLEVIEGWCKSSMPGL